MCSHRLIEVFLNMHTFCNPDASLSNITEQFALRLAHMKSTFAILQIIFCVIGITGNILNLRTLQSPSLQTVPFMYIRSLAYFDLISLSAILLHSLLKPATKNYILMVYSTYIESALINTFLVAGLYSAFMLTIVRCLMISRPHVHPASCPRRSARRRILAMLSLATIVHLPMVLQKSLKQNSDGSYYITNNVELLCREPHWTVFNYYKLLRECLRFIFVALMTFLNVVIARKLHLNKLRRRRLIRRPVPSDMGSADHQMIDCSSPSSSTSRDIMARKFCVTRVGLAAYTDAVNEFTSQVHSGQENIMPKRPIVITALYWHTSVLSDRSIYRRESGLARSFSEKRVTVLMVVICVIYILGNLPQMLTMVLQNEAMNNRYGFQLYRNIANLLEIVNHCLNFYVFCMASSEYTRAFLLNCVCLKNMLQRFPRFAEFLAARGSESVISCSMQAFGLPDREFCSGNSLAGSAASLRWGPASTYGLSNCHSSNEMNVKRLKGILVTGDRPEGREKKSLTITNHLPDPLGADQRKDTSEL